MMYHNSVADRRSPARMPAGTGSPLRRGFRCRSDMIYSLPKFFPGSDRYIEVELGDEMRFELSFLVHTLCAPIRGAAIAGVIELIPEMASLQVSYDPDRIAYEDVLAEVTRLHAAAAGSGGDLELESRLFYVPILYFDPWTEECVNDYRAKVAEKVQDPDLLCQ